MKRIGIFIYGIVSYVISLGCFAYLAGFLINVGVPTAIDGEPTTSFGWAALINAGLVALFGIQHSVMARPGFKKWWTRYVPKAAERSTYMVFSCIALAVLFAFWQPMGGTIWNVTDTAGQIALYTIYAFGWAVVLAATFVINHFDLFGLRQVWLHVRDKEYTQLKFVTPGLYRVVRHPLYVGWLIVFWATPTMTAAHLVFAAAMAAYILIAIRYEERDLVTFHGEDYTEYRKHVPKLNPFGKRDNAVIGQPAAVDQA